MSLQTIEEIAAFIVADGKGILAADESNPTCGKRFDSIGVASTEENRRDYREMLFRSAGMQENIGGVILFDETIKQEAADGTLLRDIISAQGALPGIKVDKGLEPIEDCPGETVTVGLDGLNARLQDYAAMGAKFTKWRAVINIGAGIPTDKCIDLNMQALADYAKLAQDNGMVPIVEPEVLMDGDHSIDDCYAVTERSLKSLFLHLEKNGVNIQGTLLKPNMVTSGKDCAEQASVEEVAHKTLECLTSNVPEQHCFNFSCLARPKGAHATTLEQFVEKNQRLVRRRKNATPLNNTRLDPPDEQVDPLRSQMQRDQDTLLPRLTSLHPLP